MLKQRGKFWFSRWHTARTNLGVGWLVLSLSGISAPVLLLANCSATQLSFSTVWTLRQRGLLLCTALSKHLCSFLWCSQSRTLPARRVRLHIKLCCFAWTTAPSREGVSDRMLGSISLTLLSKTRKPTSLHTDLDFSNCIIFVDNAVFFKGFKIK